MKKKNLLTLVCLLGIGTGNFAQTFQQLDDYANSYGILSENGEWALSKQQGIFSVYEVATGNVTVYNDTLYNGFDISNGGTILSRIGENTGAIYKEGKWIYLPIPEGEMYKSAIATNISDDEKTLVGYVNCVKGSGDYYMRKPCIWTLQEGDTYICEVLPFPEYDVFNRIPQATDALQCSSDGNMIIGRLVDRTGFYCLPMCWKKNAENKWEYRLLGKDYVYVKDAKIPVYPSVEPVKIDKMSFYTAADSVAYNQALEDYENGIIEQNPKYNQEKYITDPDSIAAYNAAINIYNEQVRVYNDSLNIYDEDLQKAVTGNKLDVYGMNSSANGRYLSLTSQSIDFSGPMPDIISAPAFIDLSVDTVTAFSEIKDAQIIGITGEGDLFYLTPTQPFTVKQTYVIPAGKTKAIELKEWVREKAKGKLNLELIDELHFSWEDGGTQITDSLVTGVARSNSKGTKILGSFLIPGGTGTEYINYILDLEIPDVVQTEEKEEGIQVYPNPATDVLYIKGDVKDVTVTDITGNIVYQSSKPGNSISVSAFAEGIYLVKVTTSKGEKKTSKIMVKN